MKTIGYRIEIIHPQTDKFSGFTAFFEKLIPRGIGDDIVSETINPEEAIFYGKEEDAKEDLNRIQKYLKKEYSAHLVEVTDKKRIGYCMKAGAENNVLYIKEVITEIKEGPLAQYNEITNIDFTFKNSSAKIFTTFDEALNIAKSIGYCCFGGIFLGKNNEFRIIEVFEPES